MAGVISCCIYRHCYPTQNPDTAANIYYVNYQYIWLDLLRIEICISLNIHILVLYGICHHLNIFNLLLFFQFVYIHTQVYKQKEMEKPGAGNKNFKKLL